MNTKGIKKWLWVVLPVLVVLGILLTLRKEQQIQCTGVSIVTEDSNNFLTKSDIHKFLFPQGDFVTGKNPNNTDVSKLERRLLQNPYIAAADVYFSPQGLMKIKVQQRVPIARIYDQTGKSVYLSSEGVLMPADRGINKRVLVVSGYLADTLLKYQGKSVDSLKKMAVLRDVFKTAAYLQRDEISEMLTGQLFINPDQEIELVSTIDDHIIVIGNSDSLDYKFHKLFAFYRKGLTRTGWDVYNRINLKHSNQVICTTK